MCKKSLIAMKLQTILTPIDFSTCAVNALKVAVELCRLAGARLIILHAIKDDIVLGGTEPENYTKVLFQESEEKAKNAFDDMLKNLPEIMGINYEFRISHDLLEDAMATARTNEHVDLIVMGTRGASGWRGLLFGSHTYWVVKNVKCPLLTIPENFQPKKGFQRIGLATELVKTPDDATLAPIKALAGLYESELHILHVTKSSVLSPAKTEAAWELENYFKDLKHSFRFRLDTHTEEALIEYLDQENVSMLAVVSRKRKLLEDLFHISMTRNLAFHMHNPLLILHEQT